MFSIKLSQLKNFFQKPTATAADEDKFRGASIFAKGFAKV